MHTTDADLTPAQRLREIAAILAVSILHLHSDKRICLFIRATATTFSLLFQIF